MTHTELKKIVDLKDFCIQCPADFKTNEKWQKFIYTFYEPSTNVVGYYYSPTLFKNETWVNQTPESKTVLTLDQWWSVVHGEDIKGSHYFNSIPNAGETIKQGIELGKQMAERKLYTIQDLADGKVACLNDGTVEDMNNTLGAAFPTHSKQIDFTEKYYVASKYKVLGWKGFNYVGGIPKQSVKDFVKQLEVKEWQPQPGEMVEVSNYNGRFGWCKATFHVMVNGWYVVTNQNNLQTSVPLGYKHCRPIKQYHTPTIKQYHTPTIEELKQAYAQVHGVDVELIKTPTINI